VVFLTFFFFVFELYSNANNVKQFKQLIKNHAININLNKESRGIDEIDNEINGRNGVKVEEKIRIKSVITKGR
jgi:hypothetical protein